MTKLTSRSPSAKYDRTRALTDGSVSIDGVAPVVMNLSPEEIFFAPFATPSSISASFHCRALREDGCRQLPIVGAGVPVARVPAHRDLRAHRPHQRCPQI